jgi:hypothetical protein
MYKNNVYGLGRVISVLLLFYCLAYSLYHLRHIERERWKLIKEETKREETTTGENRSEKRQREQRGMQKIDLRCCSCTSTRSTSLWAGGQGPRQPAPLCSLDVLSRLLCGCTHMAFGRTCMTRTSARFLCSDRVMERLWAWIQASSPAEDEEAAGQVAEGPTRSKQPRVLLTGRAEAGDGGSSAGRHGWAPPAVRPRVALEAAPPGDGGGAQLAAMAEHSPSSRSRRGDASHASPRPAERRHE